MKKIAYNCFFTCVLALSFAFIVKANETNTLFLQKQEFSKITYKEFNIGAYGTTQLVNKYGKIDARTWDGNQVKIKVTILVNANDQSKAEATFNRINIAFYNDANFVKAETQISESKSSWTSWSWNGNNQDFTINYEVYYPRSNFLDLHNKYGDSFIGYTNGAVKATIKYGNLRTDDINNSMELNLQYGEAHVGNVQKDFTANIDYSKLFAKNSGNANIDGDYSEIEMDASGNVNIESDYTSMRIGRADNLTLQADYGNLKLKEANNFTFNGDYTDIDIRALEKSGEVKMDYGGLVIDRLGKNFSEIRVDADYTDIKINTESGANYRLDASSKYGDINYPSDMNITFEKEGSNTERIEGFIGSKSAKGLVKVTLNYGGIRIR